MPPIQTNSKGNGSAEISFRMHTITPKGELKSALILLHGSGGTGKNFRNWLLFEKFQLPHTICYFPTAPLRRYSFTRCRSNVWHDRTSLDLDGEEDKEGFAQSTKYVHDLLDQIAQELNLPSNKIALGGFSMGGGLSLYSGLLYPKKLSSIIAMSSFLYSSSSLYSQLSNLRNQSNNDECTLKLEQVYPNVTTKIFMAHGTDDYTVPILNSQATVNQLKEIDLNIDYHVYQSLGHQLCSEELRALQTFLQNQFDL